MKYVIEVRRRRLSVTQGCAAVCVNGIEMVEFKDDIELIKEGQRWFGEKIGGWASTASDEEFIRSMLFNPLNDFYQHGKKFKRMLDEVIKLQEEKV